MKGIESRVEIDTGVGTYQGNASIHYRITRRRPASAYRELLVDFFLTAEDAFRVHSGSSRVVDAKIYDVDRTGRIADLLAILLGLGEEASFTDIAKALEPVVALNGVVRESALQALVDELGGGE